MKKTTKIAYFFILICAILHFFVLGQENHLAVCGANVSPKNLELCAQNVKCSAEAMATIETSTGRVLYAKDEHKRLPMASTTKIITAIVAIESGKDLNAEYEIPACAVGIEGSSIYLRKGEHLSLRELLYGLMLCSGNDSAVAIATIVAGSVENFVELMNEKCSLLGLKDTHLVTVNGLHDDEHYTSAYDLAKISSYALKNPTFAEIVKTKEKVINNELGKKEKVRYLKNKNKLLRKLEGADGVKTGYTRKAGRCLVASATRGGMQVVSVVLNCNAMFEETTSLIEKAFSEFKLVKLMSVGDLSQDNENVKKEFGSPLMLEKDIIYPLSADELSKVHGKIVLDYSNVKHSEDFQSIGEIQIELENNLIFSEKLYTIFVEDKANFGDNLKKIIKAF